MLRERWWTSRTCPDTLAIARAAIDSQRPSNAGVAVLPAGPLLQAQGRFASQATALRTALDLGASATLGLGGPGQARWCPSKGARTATPPSDSVQSQAFAQRPQWQMALKSIGRNGRRAAHVGYAAVLPKKVSRSVRPDMAAKEVDTMVA